jgi:drug/metabolite transporter (DMT)-like permease
MKNDNHLKADALMLLVTLIAACGWVFSKEAMQGLPPLLFIGVRFLLAGLLLVGIGAHQLRRLDTGDLLRTCATGAVMGAAMLSWILGLHHASNMGVGAFITSLGVVLAPVVGWALFSVRVTTSTWIAVMVAAVGMGCLSMESGLQFAPSDLYFLAAACAFAVHFNLNTRFAVRIPVVALTAVQLTIVGGLALLISTLSERWPTVVSGEVIGWLVASTFIATSLRFFLQIKAQGMAPLSHAAIIMTLEPVWTALVGRVWLGEQMSRIQLIGCSIIFCALLINRWRWFLRVV